MKCPLCDFKAAVSDSRDFGDHVVRRYKCPACNHVFFTEETDSDTAEAEYKEFHRNYQKARRKVKIGGQLMDETKARVICALAHADLNTTKAAVYLKYHRNNVDYHISEIRKATGLDPKSFFDLCKLYMIAVNALGGDPFK